MKDLHDMVNQMAAVLPYSKADILNYLIKGINYYSAQAKKHIRGNLATQLGLVNAFYKAVDDSLKDLDQDTLQQVTCKKGCAHCCKMYVAVSKAEAEFIYFHCKNTGIDIDEAYITVQANIKRVGDYDFSPHKACVFLSEDNTCKIYDVRPIACRKYMVVTEPMMCNTREFKGGTVASVATVKADMISAGLMDASGEYGSLPKMLLAVIKKYKNKRKFK